jgi:hypothetical protein
VASGNGAPSDSTYDYDVCLSFAGEDREYVEQVADALRDRGIRVFYDRYEEAELWGKDLYEHLAYVYKDRARYCVLFASEHYAAKVWTTHERRHAQARALEEGGEYVLPARFDDTEIPGLPSTVGHINLRRKTPDEVAGLIQAKLGPRQRHEFFPPKPDRLFEALEASDEDAKYVVAHLADRFFRGLQRMSPEERRVVLQLFSYGCPAELPENVHMSLDLLSRHTGFPPTQIKELLGGIHSLGYTCKVRDPEPGEHDEIRSDDKLVVLSWTNLDEMFEGEPTQVAAEAVYGVRSEYCEEHGTEALINLDFSALASATNEPHVH